MIAELSQYALGLIFESNSPLYQEFEIDYKNKTFFLFILGLILLFSLSIGMSLLVPVVSQFLMLISDLIVSIGFVYYKLFGLKYNMKLGS